MRRNKNSKILNKNSPILITSYQYKLMLKFLFQKKYFLAPSLKRPINY